MQIIQILAIIFAVFAASRVILRYREHKASWKELIFWNIVWIAAVIIAIFPNITFYFSRLLGIQRGIDLIIYISIIALFYLMFRLYVKIEGVEQDLTKVVREVSIKKAGKKK